MQQRLVLVLGYPSDTYRGGKQMQLAAPAGVVVCWNSYARVAVLDEGLKQRQQSNQACTACDGDGDCDCK